MYQQSRTKMNQWWSGAGF